MVNFLPENNNSLKGKQILVTGGAGFIGSHLVRSLIAGGSRVTLLLKPSTDFWRIKDVLSQVKVLAGDLSSLNSDQLKEKAVKTQIIYHLGAIGLGQKLKNTGDFFQVNALGTLAMLKLAQKIGVERFIYCGSCSEYGRGENLLEDKFPEPISEYGASKLSAWVFANMFFREHGLPVICLRPFTAYGPYEAPQRLVPYTILDILDGKDIELTAGAQTRDFVFIDDLIEVFLKAATVEGVLGDTFNVSTGESVSVKEVVSAIIELTGSCQKPLFGARAYREAELWVSSGDNSRAKEKLRWAPKTPLREGLTKTIQWFKDNRSKYSIYGTVSNKL